jgi:uncharacterized protein (DUF736 family)
MDFETQLKKDFWGSYVWIPNLQLKMELLDEKTPFLGLSKSIRENSKAVNSKEKFMKSIEIGTYLKNDSERKIYLKYGQVYEVFENTNTSEKNPDFIIKFENRIVGALWKKKSSKGNSYLSGKLLFPDYNEFFITILFAETGNTVFKQIAELETSATTKEGFEP